MEYKVSFKSILNSMRDLVLVKGPESRLLWANKAFLDYYGMSEEELRGIVDGPQSNPDDTLQYVRDDKFVFDTKKDLNIPSELVTKIDGEVNYFHTIKSPIFNEDVVEQIIGVSRLIGNADLQEQGLTQLDAKIFTAPLRAIIDSVPVPTILLDHNLRIIKGNKRWSNFFGDAPSVSNINFDSHFKVLADLTTKAKESIQTNSEAELVIQIEINNIVKFFDFKISLWKYPNDQIGGVIIVATDVTSIKKNEHRVKTANERLSSLNDELTQFSYRTSHDLKASLATLKKFSNFILKDIESGDLDEAKSNIKKILTEVNRLQELVNEALSLEKADTSE